MMKFDMRSFVLTLAALLFVSLLVGCSKEGLKKPDGRQTFVEAVNAKSKDGDCKLKATKKGKRQLVYQCEKQTVVDLEKLVGQLCESYERVGFETVLLKAGKNQKICQVDQGCSCTVPQKS